MWKAGAAHDLETQKDVAAWLAGTALAGVG